MAMRDVRGSAIELSLVCSGWRHGSKLHWFCLGMCDSSWVASVAAFEKVFYTGLLHCFLEALGCVHHQRSLGGKACD